MNRLSRLRLWRAALAGVIAACAGAPSPAWSQGFPTRPLRIIEQFNNGAPGDVLFRVIAVQVGELLGQPVIVDSRSGAGGVVAAGAVVRSAADGYTLFGGNSTVPVVSVVLSKTPPPFDPGKDLIPLTTVADIATLLVANASLPANNLREVIEYAKANPGKVSYGSTGIGSPQHLAGEEINVLTGAGMMHVPYKTSPVLDAASGALQLSFAVSAQAMPLIKTGKVKLVAVLADSRFAPMPEVPTIAEALPGFDSPPRWTGLFVPAGVPAPIVRRLHADFVRAINSPEGRARILDTGFEPMTNKSPEEFAALIKSQIELVARIVKTARIPKSD